MHCLIDIEIGAWRCVKSGQKLVYHDQQLHICRFIDKFTFRLFFKVFYTLTVEHFLINFVLFKSLCLLVIAYRIGAKVTDLRLIGSNDCALFESDLLKNLIILTRRINRTRYQHRISVSVHQTGLCFKVKLDIQCDFFQTGTGGEHLLHGRPHGLQLCFCARSQPFGFDFKPSVNFILRFDFLRDITVLVAKIQYNAIPYRFVEFICVYISAKGFKARLFVLFQQRRACEADKNSIRNNGFHSGMQFSGLCPMTLVHKYDKITLGRIIRWQGFLNFFNVLVDILVGCLAAFFAKFMDQ